MLFGKKKKLIEYLSKKQADKALTTFDATEFVLQDIQSFYNIIEDAILKIK